MGILISSIYKKTFTNKQTHILITGLDSAGKTSIVYKLGLNNFIKKENNAFYFLVDAIIENDQFIIYNFDINPNNRSPIYFHLLKSLYQNNHGIIFVVDSSDRMQIENAKFELHNMLKADELRDSIILIYANKQDLPNSINSKELSELLQLKNLRNNEWHVQESCAVTGYGLKEGFEWLIDRINAKFK